MSTEPLDHTTELATGSMPVAEPQGTPPDRTRPAHFAPTFPQTLRKGTQTLPELGDRYRVLRTLGSGGMGAVFEAVDTQAGCRVAVKMLARELTPDGPAVQRFQKEARLLGEVRHPNIANLLEIGDADGACFLVMELVEGIDLRGALCNGPLAERPALQIVREVAAALAVLHQRGIIHRDLKPANILLAAEPQPGETPAEAVRNALAAGTPVAVKLTDFGLARHIDQSSSLELTRTGSLLGTPYYIAPEQCTGKSSVLPATDLYSLGVTLFEMLAGRLPFRDDDVVRLISQHCFTAPPDLLKLNPLISDNVAALVARLLEKSPAARPADGQHLLAELDRLLSGDVQQVALHPRTPAGGGRVAETVWQWKLDASCEALWPFVANTDRINAAVGLPAVDYVTEPDGAGGRQRVGSFRLGWTRLRWVKHPFEWVEGRRFGVLREFQNGPFEWFLSLVELAPRPEGGTLLTHTVQIATRGWLGRALAYLEVNVKGRGPLDRVYRQIDRMVSRPSPTGVADEFLPAALPPAALRKRLEVRRQKLLEQQVDGECVERLLEFLAISPPQELARIRPRALAQRWQLPADRLTTACLEACQHSLLELHWDVLCPTCRVAATVTETLAEIDRHVHCEACGHDFETDFAEAVELIFRVHPEVRRADLKTYCMGGPAHAPHVVSQLRLTPAERIELDLSLDPGVYVLRSPQLPGTLRIVAAAGTGTGRAELALQPGSVGSRTVRLQAGRHLLTLRNDCPQPVIARLERTIPRTDILTAAEATQLPAFRRLFPGEILSRDRLSSLSSSTLLLLRITNVLELFARRGDAETHEQLQAARSASRLVIEGHGGRVMKEQDDHLLAFFPLTLDALEAAIELRASAPVGAEDVVPRIQLALHRGTSLSTTVNGRADVFGRSIALTSRLLDGRAQESLVISQELADDEEIRESLRVRGWRLRVKDDHYVAEPAVESSETAQHPDLSGQTGGAF